MRWVSLLVVLCLVGPAAGFSIDSYEVKIRLDTSGNAYILTSLSFNSSEISAIQVSTYEPVINAYDPLGKLNYSIGSVLIQPRESRSDYKVWIEYMTHKITSKKGPEWNFSYEIFAHHPIKNLKISVGLPVNSSLKSYAPDGKVTATGDKIRIEWSFVDVTQGESVVVNATYTLGAFIRYYQINTWLYLGLIVFVVVLFFTLYNLYPPEREEMPRGKEEVMKILNEKERAIVEEVIKAGGKLTQMEVFMRTGIPKSTLSRTLKSLERRNLIELRPIGNTNLVVIAEWMLEKG